MCGCASMHVSVWHVYIMLMKCIQHTGFYLIPLKIWPGNGFLCSCDINDGQGH